jgi:hypothetical protein
MPRNAPCPCGSGRKFKRCCNAALAEPARVARQHNAVGDRIQAWAFDKYPDETRAGFDVLIAGRRGVVVADGDLQLVGTWVLSDRELPGGGTLARRYAAREDLSADERDVASRIAAARLRLLRIVRVAPGRWIELDDLTRSERARVTSHDVSRGVRCGDVIVARIMDGPPAPSLWGPVGFLTSETGRELLELLRARVESLGLHGEPGGLATAMHAASREVTALLAPALRGARATRQAA